LAGYSQKRRAFFLCSNPVKFSKIVNMPLVDVQSIAAMTAAAAAIYAVASAVIGVAFVERALHLPREDRLGNSSLRSAAMGQGVANLEDASITAQDGVRLFGWYVRPVHDNGSTVILLHGAGHDRVRVEKQALALLRHGYRVLMPDSRGQGHSEGRLTTFGIKESDDVQRWVSWLQKYDSPKCTYGYGQSMGALILLRSLATEKRFCAVAVDSCPVSFVEAGYDLIGRAVRLGSWFGRSFGRVAMESAMLYSRLRYGVDLTDANAETGLLRTAVPVLLVWGTMDRKVPPRHVGRLSSCTRLAEVWYVPGAAHSAAIDTADIEYELRLVKWFTQPQQAKELGTMLPAPSSVVCEDREE
jgi:pimeloyl-ACP methyl ester carboxylesterase